jgi:hypothetical protein
MYTMGKSRNRFDAAFGTVFSKKQAEILYLIFSEHGKLKILKPHVDVQNTILIFKNKTPLIENFYNADTKRNQQLRIAWLSLWV